MNTQTDIEERLVNCFRTALPRLPPAQIRSASAETVAEWDSMATVTLLSLVNEEFGVPIDFESVDKLVSFDAILGYVKNAGGK